MVAESTCIKRKHYELTRSEADNSFSFIINRVCDQSLYVRGQFFVKSSLGSRNDAAFSEAMARVVPEN